MWSVVPIPIKSSSKQDTIADPDFDCLRPAACLDVISGDPITVRQYVQSLTAGHVQQDASGEDGWALFYTELPEAHLALSFACRDIAV